MAEENKMDSSQQNEEMKAEVGTDSAEKMNPEENTNEVESHSKSPFMKGKKAIKKYEEKISELESKVNDLNDKYLRLFSDFDNYRKRTGKERLELLNTASEEVIISLLPVVDDFERALAAIEKNGASGPDMDGIKLIYNKLINTLSKKGLTPMNCKEQAFDTDFHEALTIIPAPTEELKGKVIDEIEKGYLLNGKVIRFARVVVGQ